MNPDDRCPYCHGDILTPNEDCICHVPRVPAPAASPVAPAIPGGRPPAHEDCPIGCGARHGEPGPHHREVEGLREALVELCDAIGEEDLQRAESICDCADEVTHDRVERALVRARAALAASPSRSAERGERAMTDETCRNCGAPRSKHVPNEKNGGLDCPPRADGKIPVVVGRRIMDMDYDNHCAISVDVIEWRDASRSAESDAGKEG
jgi:hypothetical protein